MSWSDGDIAQLQTLMFEACSALDEAERIIRNKHTAGATGRQQPCNLGPLFRLMKDLARRLSGQDSMAYELIERIMSCLTLSSKQRT